MNEKLINIKACQRQQIWMLKTNKYLCMDCEMTGNQGNGTGNIDTKEKHLNTYYYRNRNEVERTRQQRKLN